MSSVDAANEPDEPGRASPPVLKNPSFRRLWLANFAGDMGNQVTTFALSITAVVFLHASPFEVGLIAALSRSAYLVLGIPAGVWIDQWSRKWVLVGSASLQTLVVASVPVAFALQNLTVIQLIIMAPLLSISSLFFDVVHTAVLPTLVGRDRVSEANARLSISDNTAGIIAPGAAGALLKIISAPLLYVVSTVLSLITACLVATIKVTDVPGTPLAANLKAFDEAGLRFIVDSRQTKAPNDLATFFTWNGTWLRQSSPRCGHCESSWARSTGTNSCSHPIFREQRRS